MTRVVNARAKGPSLHIPFFGANFQASPYSGSLSLFSTSFSSGGASEVNLQATKNVQPEDAMSICKHAATVGASARPLSHSTPFIRDLRQHRRGWCCAASPLAQLTRVGQLRPGVHVPHCAAASEAVAHAELARHHELRGGV